MSGTDGRDEPPAPPTGGVEECLDFLGRYPPYDRLAVPDLVRLATRTTLVGFSAGQVIVEAQEEVLDSLYVVLSGRVQLLDHSQVVDELGPGETFGHLSVLSGLPPPLSAVAVAETRCYRFPDPRSLVDHPELLTFSHYSSVVRAPSITVTAAEPGLRAVRDYMRPMVWCRADTSIRSAAGAMTRANSSCVVFDTADGLGIMTDSDCRRRVASGEVPVDAQVSTIATIPARVIDASATASSAFLEMVKHGVHHLVAVEPDGRPVGVARVIDLSTAELRDPLRIRTEIEKATTVPELSRAAGLLRPTVIDLYDSGVSLDRTSALIGAMTEALLERVIRLDERCAAAQASYDVSWLVGGSLARREPLLRSDVDTALVFQARHEGQADEREQMLAVAESVISSIEECGLRRCPDGANATNRVFNRSYGSWVGSAQHWIEHPEAEGALLLSAMVADTRPITGLALGRSLIDSVNEIGASKTFLRQMLDEALATRPPTGFVRDFVVEASGRHRGKLNLKKHGLGPVVALGRWIGVTTRAPVASTLERLTHGADVGLLTADESETLKAAYSEMFALLFRDDVEAARIGKVGSPFLQPESLDTLSRRFLRESFRAITRVQSRLESEWVSRLS